MLIGQLDSVGLVSTTPPEPGAESDEAKSDHEDDGVDPGVPEDLTDVVVGERAAELVGEGGFGYLLKDRVLQVDDFLDALQRVADGGSALDRTVVAALVSPLRLQSGTHIGALTERERDVLAHVAQGLTNSAVARQLFLSERTVEAHMRSIFQKLRIPDSRDDHRRVRAVVAYLTE